jgi:hypothetical protein
LKKQRKHRGLLRSTNQLLRQPVITLKIQHRTMSSLFVTLLLAVFLILAESYSKCPRTAVASTSAKHLIVNNGWVRCVGIISSSSRLYAAAPEAPKGKGPPPRKAPKDDVVQVSHLISSDVISHHFISHHVISHHVISHHFISYYIISHHVISHHFTSHHVISHHITSHHIISHPIFPSY